ncbi:MAG: DUF5663 domain-containing protein [Candidatus Moraniibacteriota bacterium]
MEIDYTKLKKELVEELSLKGLSAEKQEELLGKLLETLLKRIFLDTMEKLGEAGVTEYEELVQKEANEEEVARFLEKKIPDYDAFVATIIESFKSDMKTVAT